jgi:hypothetical protein
MSIRARVIVAVVATLAVGCGSTPSPSSTGTATTSPVATSSSSAPSPPASAPAPSIDPSADVAADLDGVFTSPGLAHRLPLAVSIDDNRVARPQSGFNAASIVWQAPADGYESRYLMIFQELDASNVGPVRSARIYLAQWAADLRAGFAHYGGDLLSRNWMTANAGQLFTNLDGLGAGNPAYHRISSRQAPHNAYTSTADLWRVAARLGGPATFDPSGHVRPFRDDSPAGDRGTSQQISVPYNTVKVGYAYDPQTNAYLRSLDGKPQIDPLDGKQVTARTVVVLYMTFHTSATIEPGYNARPVLGFIGTGNAQVFMEGRMVAATWSKAGVTDPTLILDANGHEIPFVRGRIFFQVVPIGTKIGVR